MVAGSAVWPLAVSMLPAPLLHAARMPTAMHTSAPCRTRVALPHESLNRTVARDTFKFAPLIQLDALVDISVQTQATYLRNPLPSIYSCVDSVTALSGL